MAKPKLSKQEQELLDNLTLFAQAGAKAGCPQDQMANFMKAGLFLQPKQLEFCAAARECDLEAEDSPNAVMSGGGRGSSKTHSILCQIFADDCQRFAGLKVLVLRKIGKANEEQIQDYRTKLLAQLPHTYLKQDRMIKFPNSSQVLLGNFKDEKDIDRYMGQEYDLIYLMESNQLTFAKKKFILTCLRTSKQGWKPRVYEDTNPGGIGMQENKQMYVIPWREGKQKETRTRYIHSTVYDNKFINKEYVQVLESLTGWQRSAWLNGDWDFAAGSYFTNFVPTVHVYPNKDLTFDERNAVRWWASYDFGFAHNAAFILFAQDKKGIIYVADEWVDAESVIFEQSQYIKAVLDLHHVTPSDLEFIAAGKDCFSRNEHGRTIAEEFSDNGLIFEQADVDRVNGWKRCHSLMGDITIGIKPTLFIHQKCKNLIEQIQKAQHSLKRPGDVEKFDARKLADSEEAIGGDDALDSFRMGIFSDPSTAVKFALPVPITRMPYQMIGMAG